jgi:prepilin-type N-terminal cleavage/methylation domain-containing protein
MNRRRAGFTIIEVSIAIVLLVIISIKITMLLEMAAEAESTDSADIALEDQARRTLDQIAFAVMGANRETLFPDPESPTFSEEVQYEVSLGVQGGVVVWGDPERIGVNAIDESQVVWIENPETAEERRVVWCNVVRPFLEGEELNGVDDNNNGIIDEKGLNFTLQGNMVWIRLSLERVKSTGEVVTKTIDTRVTLRN